MQKKDFYLFHFKGFAAPQVEEEPQKGCGCDSAVLKRYVSSFITGLIAGTTGEAYMLYYNNNFNLKGFKSPAYLNGCIITGVQQVSKDISKTILRKSPYFAELSVKNPLLFGAATGLPMWTLTRLVATPLQNSRKKEKKPFDGLFTSIVNDVGYHTVKNGLDEYFGARVYPKILPKIPCFAFQKLTEATIAGAIGGVSYILAFPYKGPVAGQSFSEAVKLMIGMAPKTGIKKLTCTLARPKVTKLIS
ncbi:hypothetical protein GPJ56_007659 [Histomonas meleagridis]|uniref:uncharacterized protein n=1 Tax=Histomonas meleagridis TaxID=135588 RepID=UPI0035594E7D|nr:hypothetical protein GPJ56_007659 [Histomonas meleagridis]KAH0802184.1 hypothetical protein GO595_005043 [Histomonas meleagridis]